jgi:hypothetical protein
LNRFRGPLLRNLFLGRPVFIPYRAQRLLLANSPPALNCSLSSYIARCVRSSVFFYDSGNDLFVFVVNSQCVFCEVLTVTAMCMRASVFE